MPEGYADLRLYLAFSNAEIPNGLGQAEMKRRNWDK
jgi:hypothetical protein